MFLQHDIVRTFSILWLFVYAVLGQGDDCGSGYTFPMEFEGVEYVGCNVLAGTLWCQIPNDDYVICPPEFLGGLDDDVYDAEGDKCESGVKFPLEHLGVEYVGCVIQAGALWCQDRRGILDSCPDIEEFAEIQEQVQQMNSGSNNYFESVGLKVEISEIMANNELTVEDEDGELSDWIEIHNLEEKEVSMEGWHLTDSPKQLTMWTFPEDLVLSPDEYLVIFASGKDRIENRTNLHTNFRMKSTGEYLGLIRKDGSVASAMAPTYPRQLEDISYGKPALEYVLKSAKLRLEESFAFLQEATPGEPNSGPRLEGPLITRVVDNIYPQPKDDDDIVISATIKPNAFDIVNATLIYRVNFQEEQVVEMNDLGIDGDGIKDDGVYTATIPSDLYTAGDMVRWYIQASDDSNNTSRDPPYHTNDSPYYHGTVIIDPAIKSPIPTLIWFTSDPDKSISVDGHRTNAVYFDGLFYDNVFTRRRGMTALTWPKPKIKMDFKGKVFRYSRDEKRVEEFNLQSFWEEPGEDSFLRETVAFQVLQEAGVPASNTLHMHVIMNKVYFGLFAFVEQVDDVFLSRNGFDAGGSLFKSSHGEFTNLRWDIATEELQWSYRKSNRRDVDNWYLLGNLTKGIAGGGPGTRSEYLFDNLNLPEIVNEMAVQTMMLNQDRCTKNFYMYYYEKTGEWFRIPWDMEGAFGISSGLGGVSATDYCMLACEQWNSPLFCDSDHPQDIAVSSSWGVALPLQSGLGGLNGGRKLLITNGLSEEFSNFSGGIGGGIQMTSGLGIIGEDEDVLVSTIPGMQTIPLDYDEDRTDGASLTGAPGTYNHLLDAILDVPWTREMYLRRLRSVVDRFMNGRLVEIITTQYNLIRSEAIKDDKRWGTGKIDRGYKQLLLEQIPTRRNQLYLLYGPQGQDPYLPEEQIIAPSIDIDSVFSQTNNKKYQYIQLTNANDFAVDVSGWEIKGSIQFTFAQGTVIPHQYSMYISPDIKAFRARKESPKALERNFVVGPWDGILPATGWVLKLYDNVGNKIAEMDRT
eukprot:TRINITY_DN4178_c0_g2_i1.p1 TRINITY_DN4178_c0_g2~~TRINITY_DN4178_c0_g2_i1.p1  ORF type:complete len:1028 (-),score=127.01 TRINITY_DN4178_c0_g2_i1:2597-5680(-)